MNVFDEHLPNWLFHQARVNGSRVAIEARPDQITYRELFDRARHLASQLILLGVQENDRVAVMMQSGFSYALALHGVMQTSAILVPINWRLTAEEIAFQIRDANVHVLWFDEPMRPLASEIVNLAGIDGLRVFTTADLPTVKNLSSVRETFQLTDPQAIIYTSGTTGRPKGAVLSYQNHWWSTTGSAFQLGLVPTDKWLVPMPLFHVGGLGVLMRSLINGSTVVIHDKFDEARVNDALENECITLLSVVPTMLWRMLNERGGRPYTTTLLRSVLLGGSAAPKDLVESALRALLPINQSYGMTEANTQITTLRSQDALTKLGSSGTPLITTRIRIMENDTECQQGTTGEIWVKGPTVISAYWNRPDATKENFVDGWFRTGDVGYLDQDGYLYVVDRRRDLIVSGGENIYPAEIESVLLSHDEIHDAGVVGIPDEVWGQVPVAVIVRTPRSELSEEQVVKICQKSLAKYKIPKHVFFVEDMPRNASGKLLRRTLRDWVATWL